jgi:ABC-type multidrug transport system ATPase subunit
VIALEGVTTARGPVALSGVAVKWDAGAHAVVGGRSDGGALLLAVIAGRVRPRAGKVRVLDGAPTDAAVRRQVAMVPLHPALPEAMRVRQVLALAEALRGDPASDPEARLAMLEVEALADRRVDSLSREEARAVALAEALTSEAVRVLLVEEPLLVMDPRAAGLVAQALRTRAAEGRAVVVTTGSMHDACELADDAVTLRAGRVGARTACAETLLEAGADGAKLRLVLRDFAQAPALVAALAGEAEVDAVERDKGAVHLRGRDAKTLARAAGHAAVEAGVDVVELRIEGEAS